jgi:hypothetical protein
MKFALAWRLRPGSKVISKIFKFDFQNKPNKSSQNKPNKSSQIKSNKTSQIKQAK